jgi:hypothetical protein
LTGACRALRISLDFREGLHNAHSSSDCSH